MGKVLADFRAWWNVAVDVLGKTGGPVQQWGKLTDDDLLQLSDEPEQLALDPAERRSRANLNTDSAIRAWLVERGLFDRT